MNGVIIDTCIWSLAELFNAKYNTPRNEFGERPCGIYNPQRNARAWLKHKVRLNGLRVSDRELILWLMRMK